MSDFEESGPDHRSAWRRVFDFPLTALLIGIVVFACIATIGVFFQEFHPPMSNVEFAWFFATVNIALCFFGYKLILRHLGEHPRDDLRFRGAARDLGLGLLIGLVLFSAIVGVAALFGVYTIVACCSTGQLIVILLNAGATAAVMEELLFRGILFRWIEQFVGSWVALLVTALLFGLVHRANPNASWFSSFAIAVEAGILLGGTYMLTRSLWLPIGLHAAWNFAEGYIFGVPVSGLAEEGMVTAKLSGPLLLSGGSFGLEASIIAVAIAGAAGVWFVWMAVKRGELVHPWQMRCHSA